ncbi:alpha-amylase A-like [Episyrphus balteatus]|uniref:alpha-amylase A-like n=1 Tax=Episyrphus balteatus TaxID=286459 RepID=UPI002486CA08|nr:alpha-amylase A-like [Episyrphus balteatus]
MLMIPFTVWPQLQASHKMTLFLTTLLLVGSSLIIHFRATETAGIFGENYHDPHFKDGRTVIVQLFEWKFVDIAKECKQMLGPGGFGGVQVSPVTENAIRRDFDRPWWERYNPISYQIITRSGNRDELKDMIRTCNDEGVRIYIDIVINHMAAPIPFGNFNYEGVDEVENLENADVLLEGTGGSQANASARDYPGVPYTSSNFHKKCSINDRSDGQQIRNCDFLQLPDLDHYQDSVFEKLVKLFNELIEMGVAGFRVDSAKYIWPVDFKKIFEKLNNLNTDFGFAEGMRPFCLIEVIDTNREAISKTEYSGYGVVTETQHAIQIAEIFNGKKPLSALLNWGPAMGFLLPPDGLVFVDTHYTQRGHGLGGNMDPESILSFARPKKYTMAIACMLAHPYGIKRIMSSFRFKNPDQGPPADEDEAIVSPEFNDDDGQCVENSEWVCEHRWNAIANMVAFANYVTGEGINSFQNAGPNHVAFCRGSKGFLAINNDPGLNFERRMYACVQPGDYCDVISGSLVDGNCTGRLVTVDEQRMVVVMLAVDDENGVLAIHEGAKLE